MKSMRYAVGMGSPSRIFLFFFALFWGLAIRPARATVVLGYDLPGLVAASDQIVRGRVISQHPRWDTDKRRIFTDVLVAVEARYKGGPSQTVTIQRLGGTIGDLSMKVVGEPAYTNGEEVFLFLREHKGMAAASFCSPVGMAQGKLHVVREQGKPAAVQFHPEGMTKAVRADGAPITLLHATATETPLDELEARVRALVGSSPPATATPPSQSSGRTPK